LSVTIKDLGGRVATIWSELRPATRQMVERALEPGLNASGGPARNTPYDARADLELSRLLTALDEGAAETTRAPGHGKRQKLRQVADTCAAVLLEQTRSAEVFAQLVARAEQQRDYARIDALANILNFRFAASEICELARAPNQVVRALARDSLTQIPTPVLVALLHDPVDAEIAREALQRQAREFGSEQARQVLTVFDQIDVETEEF
jgi:hypothetical protein